MEQINPSLYANGRIPVAGDIVKCIIKEKNERDEPYSITTFGIPFYVTRYVHKSCEAMWKGKEVKSELSIYLDYLDGTHAGMKVIPSHFVHQEDFENFIKLSAACNSSDCNPFEDLQSIYKLLEEL